MQVVLILSESDLTGFTGSPGSLAEFIRLWRGAQSTEKAFRLKTDTESEGAKASPFDYIQGHERGRMVNSLFHLLPPCLSCSAPRLLRSPFEQTSSMPPAA